MQAVHELGLPMYAGLRFPFSDSIMHVSDDSYPLFCVKQECAVIEVGPSSRHSAQHMWVKI